HFKEQGARKSATASFSRLSQQFSRAGASQPASTVTAPAFYQTSLSAPYSEHLAASNASLVNSDSGSMPKFSNASNFLDSQFDELEVSQRKRHIQQSEVKSLLVA